MFIDLNDLATKIAIHEASDYPGYAIARTRAYETNSPGRRSAA